MDDSSTADSDKLTLGHSVASILGIKGALRFRPHGSTQKAHVILRRVTSSDDSSDDGEVNNVVRFSLFAQKRIEVKPGKEILLSVATSNGLFKDQPVVLEGEITLPGDISDEEGDTQVADEEDIFLPPIGEVIPPKMRRAWTKKTEDMSPAISTSDHRPAGQRLSVSVQVEPPLYVSTSTQVECLRLTTSAAVQVDLSDVQQPTPSQKSTRQFADSAVQTETELLPYTSISQTSSSSILFTSRNTPDFKVGERSLSPMELDSAPTSPQLSPCSSLPYSPSSGPIDPSSMAQSVLPSPLPLVPSHLGAQEEQMPLFDLNSPNSPSIASSSGDNPQPPAPLTKKLEAETRGIRQVTSPSPKPILERLRPPLVPGTSSYMGVDATGNTPTRPGKPSVHNPFVSAGFITEFVDSAEGPPEGENNSVMQSKVEVLESKPLTAFGSSDSRNSSSTSTLPHSTIASFTSAKPQLVDTSSRPQGSAASSSKAPLGRTTPTKPMHYLRLSSSRAFEKSPVIPGAPGLQQRGDFATKRSSPPPDLKSLAYISTGPSSNPLNIRPSAVMLYGPERSIPTAPKTLTQTAVKKRMVVGSGWPLVKPTHCPVPTAPTPLPAPVLPPTSTTPPFVTRSATILKRSPSPPPNSFSHSRPALTPQVYGSQAKWKRVAADTADASMSNGGTTNTPSKPNIDGRTDMKGAPKSQNLLLTDKNQAGRMAPLSVTTSTTTTPVLPAKINGRGLRSRVSDVVSLSRSETVSPSTSHPDHTTPPLSPTSSLLHRSSAHAHLTPSLPSPVVSVTTPLSHPLPLKPTSTSQSSSSRSVKRERPNSPDNARKKKRMFRWPTVDSNYTTRLLGDGQLGIRSIAFSSNGGLFALCCADRTVRIWNSRSKTEIARLTHNASVLAVAWMEGDSGVVSLAEDGLISKWTRSGVNYWEWAKVLEAGKNDRPDDDQVCLAYARDRIAVSFPRFGVKVWLWLKGTWQPQRSILRQNVTAIKLVDEGALIGGTRDGVLWYCDIPNGTLRALCFLQSKIQSLALTPSGSHVLAGTGGCAKVFSIRQSAVAVERIFTCNETEARPNSGFGAVFATEGQAVLFGAVDGCVLVWDRKRGAIVYGLEHDEDDTIQAVAAFDGPTNKEGFIITGTKTGQLSWWSQPVAAPPS